jgi:LysM repeat protein
MANKKPAAFNPDAKDLDGDGMVQEGTEFERPVACACPAGECACDNSECEPEPTPEPATAEAPAAKTYTAKDGDTYASIAAAHKPAGTNAFDYAQALYEWNNAKPLRAGVEVTL